MTDGNAPVARGYPVTEPMRQFALGDIVEIREGSPFAYEFKGIQLKIISLRIDPDGKQWASTIDFKPGYLPRHRGNGFYDSETTDIDAEHFSLIRPGGVAQPPTKPWVCCNCDADLSCGACGVEQPNDSAYYEGIVKENELMKDQLETAQKIIAEYQASTIAGATADVAAHGLPGARGQGGPDLERARQLLIELQVIGDAKVYRLASEAARALSLSSTVLSPAAQREHGNHLETCTICLMWRSLPSTMSNTPEGK